MSLIELYPWLRTVHMGCAATSLALFITRGIWMLQGSAMLQRRWVRVLPHAVDSLLLASAIALATALRQAPFVHDWLTAKLIALLVYIVLGSIALKRGRTRGIRAMAFALALLVFGYIVAVARSHMPFPWS